MKLSESFRIQLLKRSWRRGIGPFLKMGLLMLINSGPIVSVLGYSRDCRDGVRFTGYRGKKVVFHNFTTWEEIPNELKKTLVMEDERHEEKFENILKRGWRLWIGTIGDQLAIFRLTRTSSHSAEFFFPIGEKAVLLWYQETLPAYRGMNLTNLELDHMIQTLEAEGTHTLYVTTATHNYAAQRVIEKANFQVIGVGLLLAGSTRGRVWIPAKKAQESKMTA